MTSLITESIPFNFHLSSPTIVQDPIHCLFPKYHLLSVHIITLFFVNSPFLWNSVPTEVLQIKYSGITLKLMLSFEFTIDIVLLTH